jgi:hypothetical protein
VANVPFPKQVKSDEVESAMLSPRRISIVVAVDFGIVVIDNNSLGA